MRKSILCSLFVMGSLLALSGTPSWLSAAPVPKEYTYEYQANANKDKDCQHCVKEKCTRLMYFQELDPPFVLPSNQPDVVKGNYVFLEMQGESEVPIRNGLVGGRAIWLPPGGNPPTIQPAPRDNYVNAINVCTTNYESPGGTIYAKACTAGEVACTDSLNQPPDYPGRHTSNYRIELLGGTNIVGDQLIAFRAICLTE